MFKVATAPAPYSGSFSGIMVAECAKLGGGMQPVCDHHAYCESAARVIYFGQGAKHLSQWTARDTESSWPSGRLFDDKVTDNT